jgi:osomolarity two-component system, sensor histidine kinase SLN1
LKFTKEGGEITINCYFVGKNSKMIKKPSLVDENSDFSSPDSSKDSDEADFNRDHSIDTVFKSDPNRDKIVIEVTDTGIGIKKKDRVKLFKLFGCLQNTRQMNTQGIGLGLVISENLVKTFGGNIGVKSKYGQGTKFAFSFVLGKDEDFVDYFNEEVVL